MNLIIRLILTLIKCSIAKRISLLDLSRLKFRAMPLDCDVNMHVTNSRYLSFMDLGRIYHIASMPNLFKAMLKRRWAPVLVGVDIKFVRSIKPFQKFYVQTHLLTWDEKYLYLEQRFLSDSALYAVALTKGMFLEKGKPVPMSELLKIMGFPEQTHAPAKPLSIQHWQALAEAKRQEDTNN